MEALQGIAMLTEATGAVTGQARGHTMVGDDIDGIRLRLNGDAAGKKGT